MSRGEDRLGLAIIVDASKVVLAIISGAWFSGNEEVMRRNFLIWCVKSRVWIVIHFAKVFMKNYQNS